jgi:predicted GIY-YIG superfamily endonuclease
MHAAGKGAKYTRGRAPLKLVYCEYCQDHGAALRRELEVKGMTKREKLQLCAAHQDDLNIEVKTLA